MPQIERFAVVLLATFAAFLSEHRMWTALATQLRGVLEHTTAATSTHITKQAARRGPVAAHAVGASAHLSKASSPAQQQDNAAQSRVGEALPLQRAGVEVDQQPQAEYDGYAKDLRAAAGRVLEQGRDPSLGKLVVPKFWTGKPAVAPERYVIDCVNIADVRKEIVVENSQLVQDIRGTFDEVGVVHVRNTGLGDDLGSMRLCAKLPMPAEMVYEGGANARDQIVENVFDTGAPADAWLHYHHEMAYVNESTTMLGFCVKASPWTKVSQPAFF